jgi:hypothetical protein
VVCAAFTNPSIHVLMPIDTGLDAYNAHNVVESLATLARDYNRTVIFTIHQPRSNIVALFDELLVLARGRVVYSGAFAKCHAYLEQIGHPCPPGFNIADYLIDLTSQPAESATQTQFEPPMPSLVDNGNVRDQEQGLRPPPVRQASGASGSGSEGAEENVELGTNRRKQGKAASIASTIRKRTSKLFGSSTEEAAPLPPLLAELINAYANSDLARETMAETANGHGLPDVQVETDMVKGRNRASLWTQFRILSGRAFKNLYRDPALLATHYIAAFILACRCPAQFSQTRTNEL